MKYIYLVAGVVAMIVLGACASTPSTSAAPHKAAPAVTAPHKAAPAVTAPVTVAPVTVAPVTAPAVTSGQSNASASAAQYLSDGQGFSRQGLIEQLSSQAGEGFSLADATYGVDAGHTDWNAQAVISAKSYLSTMPFSRQSLIEQLSSSSGAGFTLAQAVYGVTQAGL